MRYGTAFLAAAGVLLAPQAIAQQAKSDPGDDIMKKAVNVPGTNWSVYGPGQTVKKLKDDGVPGGEVLRATVTTKGANAWDVGASSRSRNRSRRGTRSWSPSTFARPS